MKPTKNTKPTKTVLWRNQPAINEMEAKLSNLLPLVEDLVTEYYKLPFCKPEAGINNILAQSKDEAKAYHLSLIPDSIEMGTLKLNKEAAIKAGLFAEPRYPEFEKILDQCLKTELQQLFAFFKIVEGSAILNPATWEAFVQRNSIIAQTQDELDMLDKWQNFLNSAIDFDKFLRKNCDLILLQGVSIPTLNRFAKPDPEGGIQINAQVFEALTKKLKANKL